jgi:hypothetical protein
MGYKRKNGGCGTVVANITEVAMLNAQANSSAQNRTLCVL